MLPCPSGRPAQRPPEARVGIVAVPRRPNSSSRSRGAGAWPFAAMRHHRPCRGRRRFCRPCWCSRARPPLRPRRDGGGTPSWSPRYAVAVGRPSTSCRLRGRWPPRGRDRVRVRKLLAVVPRLVSARNHVVATDPRSLEAESMPSRGSSAGSPRRRHRPRGRRVGGRRAAKLPPALEAPVQLETFIVVGGQPEPALLVRVL